MAETNYTNHSENKPKKRRRSHGGIPAATLKVLGTIVLIGITTGAILACFSAIYIKTVIMPDTKLKLTDFSLDLTTTMYYTDAGTGERVEMQTLHGDENRVWVDFNELPKNLIDAAVAIEDKRFYEHHGVDWIRTAKSVINMFTGQDIQGGSTLTQQLIKNITDDNQVTVKRKITEIFRALELEKTHSKEDILEWYLNYIYLGEGCSGVYTASYAYFGKNVSELSLAECASLISITNNPSVYNPYTNRENNKQRQELVLSQMCEQHYISEEERDQAIAQELVFLRGEDEARASTIFTWYEDQVITDVITDLSNTMGISEDAAADMVYSGGLEIDTCFDPNVQAAVDAVYSNRDNLNYTSASGQLLQSGITVIDNVTGNVVALSGGIGEKTGSRGWNRATDTVRPPGSSIKPLSVYGPALDMGLITPATVVEDSPYQMVGDSPWPIDSYGEYRGLMTVYEALQDSANTVAVRVLGDYITPQIAFDFLTQKLGFTTLVESKVVGNEVYTDIGLSQLALGGLTNGVSTYEMAAAYSTFARSGVYTTPRTYTKVTNSDGEVLLENKSVSEVVMKESTAWYINYMLKNVVAAGTGTNAKFSGMTIAGKTGTTSSRKDLWFVGYTPYYTAAVWTGYDQQERLGSSLGNPSTTLWRKVMSAVHENLAKKDFEAPSGAEIVTASYCLDSGLLATEYCKNDPRGSRVTTGQFLKDDVPTQYCTIHTPVEVCVDSPILRADGTETGMYHLAGPYCPQESIRTISVLDYLRTKLNGSVVLKDDIYLKSYLELAGLCDVHTQFIPDPADFDINDPATWPMDDPLFDPLDPTTWPDTGSGEGEEQEQPEQPQVVTPDVAVTDTPVFTPPPVRTSLNPVE